MDQIRKQEGLGIDTVVIYLHKTFRGKALRKGKNDKRYRLTKPVPMILIQTFKHHSAVYLGT